MSLLGTEGHQVFIDFENAVPTGSEQQLYAEIADLLSDQKDLLSRIEEYKGCQAEVQKAMKSAANNPAKEADEKAAFEALLRCVVSIDMFYHFSLSLREKFPTLLNRLARPPGDEKEQGLGDCQALGKLLGDILSFTLQFDFHRMTRSISNDFAFYRRMLGKNASHPDIIVNDDKASDMSMFTAKHNPMIMTLIDATCEAAKTNPNVCPMLAIVANACLGMLKAKTYQAPETNLFCARAMTGCIVLFDHADQKGVFVKSPVQLKNAVLLLKKDFKDQQYLLNAIHFSSRTYNNAPSSIKEIFES